MKTIGKDFIVYQNTNFCDYQAHNLKDRLQNSDQLMFSFEYNKTCLWFQDSDKDGYGDPHNSIISDSCPDGYVENNKDCDDNNAAVNPGRPEIFANGFDDDCSGVVDGGRFRDLQDGTILDIRSGLIWLKNASCFYCSEIDKIEKAMAKVDEIQDGYCGLKDGSKAGDWRLPTKIEWVSFVDKKYQDPVLCNSSGSEAWKEGDAFINVELCAYWAYYFNYNFPSFPPYYMDIKNGRLGWGNRAALNGCTYRIWPVKKYKYSVK